MYARTHAKSSHQGNSIPCKLTLNKIPQKEQNARITDRTFPDADDLFMYYAITFGWVSHENIAFNNVALDIQTLNEKALQGALDISAISFGVYPLLFQEQCLLRTGVSFGSGYGPKLIKKKTSS